MQFLCWTFHFFCTHPVLKCFIGSDYTHKAFKLYPYGKTHSTLWSALKVHSQARDRFQYECIMFYESIFIVLACTVKRRETDRSYLKKLRWIVKLLRCWSACKCNDILNWFSVLCWCTLPHFYYISCDIFFRPNQRTNEESKWKWGFTLQTVLWF